MLNFSRSQKIKLFSALLITIGTFFLISNNAQAAIENPVVGDLGKNEGASDGSKFIGYMVFLWRASVSLGGLAVILFFLLGAFEWITAGGDKNKIESARSKMTNSVIGLVLLVSSFVLLGFMSKLLFGDNFNILKLTIPGIEETVAPSTEGTYDGEVQYDNNYQLNKNGDDTPIMR